MAIRNLSSMGSRKYYPRDYALYIDIHYPAGANKYIPIIIIIFKTKFYINFSNFQGSKDQYYCDIDLLDQQFFIWHL